MSEEVIYDPTEAQLKALDRLGLEEPKLDDLCNPTAVNLLIQQRRVNLMELMELKHEQSRLLIANEKLRDDRENLRIELARSQERQSISWLEILVGIISGFSINLLTMDWKNSMGWFLLLISTVMLLYLRMPQISAILKGQGRKEKDNA
ncbi:MAG: hypothetical protein ACUVV0_10535 [Anaerolineae bacterium]